jgi:hypothetical protein
MAGNLLAFEYSVNLSTPFFSLPDIDSTVMGPSIEKIEGNGEFSLSSGYFNITFSQHPIK